MPTRGSPLREYRAKRDFAKSPEPKGKANAAVAPRKRTVRKAKFCVQKHLATRLHYDFRLEHRGVLLSWAVPKGPSLNPKDKRLAMRVEDHPLEYADFEGIIPGGYGMGIVMVWDRGTWTSLVDDLDAALKAGNLKFALDGVKLKGEWALVRLGWPRRDDGASDDGSRESWLLIKKKDDWSGDVDIAALAPKSAKSKGDFEDILRRKEPAIWKSRTSADAAVSNAAAKKILQRLTKLRQGARKKSNR